MQSAAGVGRGGSVFPISRFVVGAALLVGVLPFFGVVRAQDQPATQKNLYHRIGGYDAIAGVVDDFLKQLQADPAFQRFGQGRSQNSLVRGRQLIVEQICHLSGGPCVYIGREMKPAHQGLAITQAEWEAAGKKASDSIAAGVRSQFAFFRIYAAAVVKRGSPSPLSAKSLDFLATLERKYTKR